MYQGGSRQISFGWSVYVYNDVMIKWVSFLPGEPAAAEVAKHSALHWSHVGTQSVHET